MSGVIDSATDEAMETWVKKAETVKRAFLSYPMAKKVERDLDIILKTGTQGSVNGTSAATYMLIGESGSGKTALITRFIRKHPKRIEPGQDVMPVLFVEVPANSTMKSLATKILEAMGAHVPASVSEPLVTARALDHLRHLGVKILFLDEAQHLICQEKQKLSYAVADWVKSIANSGICAVALSGVPDVWEAYLYNGQLKRRSWANRKLSKLRFTDDREYKLFQGFVSAYEGILPFEEPSRLSDPTTVLRLHRQCDGLVGRLSDFLHKATIIGLYSDLPNLGQDTLEEVADQLRDLGNPNWQNPFLMTYEELEEETLLAEDDGFRRPGLAKKTRLRKSPRAIRQSDIIG